MVQEDGALRSTSPPGVEGKRLELPTGVRTARRIFGGFGLFLSLEHAPHSLRRGAWFRGTKGMDYSDVHSKWAGPPPGVEEDVCRAGPIGESSFLRARNASLPGCGQHPFLEG